MRQDYYNGTITKFIKMLLLILRLTIFANLKGQPFKARCLKSFLRCGYTKVWQKALLSSDNGADWSGCLLICCLWQPHGIKACNEVSKTPWSLSIPNILRKQPIDSGYYTDSEERCDPLDCNMPCLIRISSMAVRDIVVKIITFKDFFLFLFIYNEVRLCGKVACSKILQHNALQLHRGLCIHVYFSALASSKFASNSSHWTYITSYVLKYTFGCISVP